MDFRQLSTQIGTQPVGGELQTSSGGGPLGLPSPESGFSTILQALSHKTDDRVEVKPRAPQTDSNDRPFRTRPVVSRGLSRKSDDSRGGKPRASQAEADDRPSSTTSAAPRGLSRKTDGSRVTKSRAAQTETDDQSPSRTPAVHRALSSKADSGADSEPRVSQSETGDEASTTTSDTSTPVSQETSDATDAESRGDQANINDEPSTTTSGSEPLLLSLLGATLVTQTPPIAATQQSAGANASTNQVDGHSGISEMPTIQPGTQPVEGITSPGGAMTGLSDLPGHKTTSATGDAVAALSSPMPESQPLSAGIDQVTPVVEKTDISQPLTAVPNQLADSNDPHQKLPSMEQPEEGLPQSPVTLGQVTANGQDSARTAATVAAQPTGQNGDGVAAQPDRSQAQQILGKGDASLHQRNMQTESSAAQAAAALSGHMQTEGQGFNTESDGQRKEEGLKWFSRADLQSAEVSSRQPQQPAAEALDSGPQSLSYQQGQGGTPSNIKAAPAQAVPLSPQANRLSPDIEAAPVPVTHAVQFDLAPADFGQLRVRVVLSDQTVHTHLSTDRAELGQMLTSQQEQLSTQLSGAGLDLGRFQVQVDQQRTSHSGQEWQSQAQGGTSQQQRDSRQQDRQPDIPVPVQKRTGTLSLFA